jgi:hypothetical protein
VRNVISTTGKPPASNASAKGNACSADFIAMTGTTPISATRFNTSLIWTPSNYLKLNFGGLSRECQSAIGISNRQFPNHANF